MRYLLDSDVLIELLRGTPCPALLRRLAATPADAQATSSVAVAEVLTAVGGAWVDARDLSDGLERALLPNLAVLPFDGDAARAYAELRAGQRLRQAAIADADAQVAAIALARGLVLVTSAPGVFAGVPTLEVEDWSA